MFPQRQRQQRQANKQQQGVPRPVPPPIGGWNARDSLQDMDPRDAVMLDNWFPRRQDVAVRKGYTLHCTTGESTAVKTLMTFKDPTVEKLIAAVNGKLISVGTGSPSTLATGFSADEWRRVMFGGKLHMVNGADAPRTYDGTTVATPSWSGSGLTTSNLSDIMVYRNRLWFIEKDTLNAWYAGLQAVTGTLSKFDLSLVAQFGGKLVGIGNVAISSNSTNDNLICFFLSSGEVVTYFGSDPSDAASFTIQNRYKIGQPVDKSFFSYGGDTLLVTESGYVPFKTVMPYQDIEDQEARLLSAKINQDVVPKIASWFSNPGWQMFVDERERQLIVNVPKSTATFEQHVMNLDTKAWCKFTGINSRCWGEYARNTYFGSTDGKVYKANYGYNDNGTAITADGQGAWNYHGDRSTQKTYTLYRFFIKALSDPLLALRIGVDFETRIPQATVSTGTVNEGGEWNTAEWNSSYWGGDAQVQSAWATIEGHGFCMSVRKRVTVTAQEIAWLSGQAFMKPGGVL